MADTSNLSSNLPRAGAPRQMPVFQASASGGVVATLQPGQSNFEGEIRSESDRLDGFTRGALDAALDEQEIKKRQVAAGAAGMMPPQATGARRSDLQAVSQKTAPNVPLPANPGLDVAFRAKQPVATINNSGLTSDLGSSGAKAPRSVRNFRVGAQKEPKPQKGWLMPFLIVGLTLIVVGVFAFYFMQRSQELPLEAPQVAEKTIVDYWGLWEKREPLDQVIKDFEDENPDVSVNYVKKNINGYRAELQRALQSDNGPTIFRYHASWRPFLDEQLANLPESVISGSTYQRSFYPVTSEQLTDDEGNIKGVPLMYDSLALLYNKDILRENNIEVPTSWSQFGISAVAMTTFDDDGHVTQAGAAFGLMDNVEFSSDIIGLLMLQSGVDFQDLPGSAEKIQQAVKFYTDYYTVKNRRVWDEHFDNSTLAFARGQVAMIFAPSWLIHDILKIEPTLNIGVASVPQLGDEQQVEWATYYAEGVNARASESSQLAAWRLLEYLSRPAVMQKLNEAQEKQRSNFGEIYSRPDLADELADDKYVQPYVLGAINGKNVPLNDRTYDEALNDKSCALLKALVSSFVTGRGDPSGQVQGFITDLAKLYEEYGYYKPEEDK